jgi:hypothetical protein
MPLFEIGDDRIRRIEQTSFGGAGLKERTDLQRLLRDQVEIIASDVLVIAEEFGEWTDSRRRIDLLGVDKDANLVVIELKRTEDGGHMELQALRYAAMVSTLTAERAVEIFRRYLESRGRAEDPQQTLLEFLEWEEFDEDQFAQDVRIVLVSANFSRELTTAVMWLNEKDLDVRCVRMQPYDYEGRTFIDIQQVIPLPEAIDYQVRVREKKRQERRSRPSTTDFTRYDIVLGDETYPDQWKRNAILLVVKHLVARGITPIEIGDSLLSIRRGVWCSIDGEVKDVEVFNDRAAADAEARRSQYVGRRWHTREGDLLISGGRTYAFTNQWGKRWKPAMELLQRSYPEIGLRWIARKNPEDA